MQAAEGRRALIVDPNPASALALRAILERHGYHTECCLGPTSRCGPCPLLETGFCVLVDRASGPQGLAIIALPPGAQFTTDIEAAYRPFFDRVMVVGEGDLDGLLTDPALTELARAQVDELSSWLRSIVVGLASTIGGDVSTPSRATRVAWLALQILQRLDGDAAAHPITEYAMLLRDIGCVAADDATNHPVRGAEILSAIPPLRDAIPIVRHHHERWDGTGSPDHLIGEQIPTACRALALAEAFDAAIWEGGVTKAVETVTAQRGLRFDPGAVDILIALLDAGTLSPILG